MAFHHSCSDHDRHLVMKSATAESSSITTFPAGSPHTTLNFSSSHRTPMSQSFAFLHAALKAASSRCAYKLGIPTLSDSGSIAASDEVTRGEEGLVCARPSCHRAGACEREGWRATADGSASAAPVLVPVADGTIVLLGDTRRGKAVAHGAAVPEGGRRWSPPRLTQGQGTQTVL